MTLIEQIERIERVDQLIRMKATGSPSELSKRLNISKRNLYYLLGFMKKQGVKIYYCSERKSFCYEQEAYFYFGFFSRKTQLKKIKGGKSNNSFFLKCKIIAL